MPIKYQFLSPVHFQSIKKRSSAGAKSSFCSLIFRILTPDLAPYVAKQRRLPGFTGPFPPPLSIRTCIHLRRIFYIKIPALSREIFGSQVEKRRIDIFRSHRYSNKGKILPCIFITSHSLLRLTHGSTYPHSRCTLTGALFLLWERIRVL